MYTYPPLWGDRYWFLIHASAYSYVGQELSKEESTHIYTFLMGIGYVLPCSTCSIHCQRYMTEHPPYFETGDEYWKYTVRFHNSINVRTGTMTLTYTEARQCVVHRLLEYGGEGHTTFLDVFWVPIMYSCCVYANNPKLATAQESDRLSSVLSSVPYIHAALVDMRAHMSTVSMQTNSTHNALTTVCDMHNILGAQQRTVADAELMMIRLLKHAPVDFVHRAYRKRVEDHNYILSMKRTYNIIFFVIFIIIISLLIILFSISRVKR
jgi:hypothetical protein